ncbi:hypothetical protein AGMMS49543_08630 [Betaproteobacteria bacterium]|nr:hypothetical protein AGMMS49543_08630 [Betaproteobacteria bacterium]GHU18413.1 hypothetical protein AGMMS50243_08400 [Betaproteobacteria bacterium]
MSKRQGRADAFTEDALSEQDAVESGDDQAPAFITEGESATKLPTFVDTANVRSLYGWKPGETLDEAMARKARES